MQSGHSLLDIFIRRFHGIFENRRAGIALMVGLSLPFLIGAAGFATDSAFWFAQHTALQSAADAAAVAAARDLETNPGVATTTLESDAVEAANSASSNQFGLTTSGLTVTVLTGDSRQVEADATAPAKLFFSPVAHMGNFNIHTRAVAGVAYSLISTQASCQALDSFTYIYSTGFGTMETAHSAGIDPYTCGQAAMVPPLPGSAFCNSGVLSCSLSSVTNALGVNVGASLLPLAFQVEPNNYNGSNGTLLALSSVLGTITSLLGGATSTSTGAPAVFQQGSLSCPANVCTIPAGVYPGGIVIGPGVTFNFATNGSGLGNNYFLLLNGNLVISTQAVLGSGTNNFTFFMMGATPGAYVAETQVQLNLAPVSQGAVSFVSTASLKYSSLLGMQISAPLPSMPYAEQQAASMGLLGSLGLPGGNLLGANYMSVASVCTQATSLCTTPLNVQGPAYQTALVPSLNSVSSAAAVLNLVNGLGLTPLTTAAGWLLNSSGETSSTSFTSNIAIANGMPTDWAQTEAQTEALSNSPAPLSLLGALLGWILPDLQTVSSYLTGSGSSGGNAGSSNASGVFPGQISSGGATGCVSGMANLYTGTSPIAPGFGPVFTNLVGSGTSTPAQGQTLALSTSDSISVCGTESRAVSIAQILPGQSMTYATAAGASTLALLK